MIYIKIDNITILEYTNIEEYERNINLIRSVFNNHTHKIYNLDVYKKVNGELKYYDTIYIE